MSLSFASKIHTKILSVAHPHRLDLEYRKTANTSRTLGNKIVDHSDVVGASPVGAAPTTSSFSTWHWICVYEYG